MSGHPLSLTDFSKKPFLVIWETTKACDLACVHCRASAEPEPDPDELSTEEGFCLIDQVCELGTRILVLSGGDPLKRKDLVELIRYGKKKRLRVGAIPACTPALTRERLVEFKKAGLDQVAFSLDSADEKTHDGFRRTEGTFKRTLEAVKNAKDVGLPMQINSLLNLH